MSSTDHLNEDDLVLHYYGELDPPATRGVEQHLAGCADCRQHYTRLQRVMAAVDTVTEPALPESFERVVWARLERELPSRRGWWSAFVLSPATMAWAAAVVVLVAGAFFAGRITRQPPASTTAAADELRENILLNDVGEHLERSQMMLVDLVTADGDDVVDVRAERERAEELVAANRLYRQSAEASGEARITAQLDELERVLVELAATPDTLTADEMERVRTRLDASGVLFKVRVFSSSVRERQQQQIRARTGQSSAP
jgi:hypothetical protein